MTGIFIFLFFVLLRVEFVLSVMSIIILGYTRKYIDLIVIFRQNNCGKILNRYDQGSFFEISRIRSWQKWRFRVKFSALKNQKKKMYVPRSSIIFLENMYSNARISTESRFRFFRFFFFFIRPRFKKTSWENRLMPSSLSSTISSQQNLVPENVWLEELHLYFFHLYTKKKRDIICKTDSPLSI